MHPPFKIATLIHPMRYPVLILMLCLLAFLRQESAAGLRLPNILGEGMVLQRDKPVSIWGWASPGVWVGGSSSGSRSRRVGAPRGKKQKKVEAVPFSAGR